MAASSRTAATADKSGTRLGCSKPKRPLLVASTLFGQQRTTPSEAGGEASSINGGRPGAPRQLHDAKPEVSRGAVAPPPLQRRPGTTAPQRPLPTVLSHPAAPETLATGHDRSSPAPLAAAASSGSNRGNKGTAGSRSQRRKRPAVRAIEEALDDEHIDPETGEAVLPPSPDEGTAVSLKGRSSVSDSSSSSSHGDAAAASAEEGSEQCYECCLCLFAKEAEDDHLLSAADAARWPAAAGSGLQLQPPSEQPVVPVFTSLSALVDHITSEHVECDVPRGQRGRRKIACPLCRRHFIVYAGIEDVYRRVLCHARDQHGYPLPAHYALPEVAVPLSPLKVDHPSFTCPVCGLVRSSMLALSVHVNQRHSRSGGPGLVACPVCSQYILHTSVDTHMTMKHNEQFKRIAALSFGQPPAAVTAGNCGQPSSARQQSLPQLGPPAATLGKPAAYEGNCASYHSSSAASDRPLPSCTADPPTGVDNPSVDADESHSVEAGSCGTSLVQQPPSSSAPSSPLRTRAELPGAGQPSSSTAAYTASAGPTKEEPRDLTEPSTAATVLPMPTTNSMKRRKAASAAIEDLGRECCPTGGMPLSVLTRLDSSAPCVNAEVTASSVAAGARCKDAHAAGDRGLTIPATAGGTSCGLGGEERLMCTRCCKKILGAHNLSRHMVLVHGAAADQLP